MGIAKRKRVEVRRNSSVGFNVDVCAWDYAHKYTRWTQLLALLIERTWEQLSCPHLTASLVGWHLTSGFWFLRDKWCCATFMAVVGCITAYDLQLGHTSSPNSSDILQFLVLVLGNSEFSGLTVLWDVPQLCLLICSLIKLRHGLRACCAPEVSLCSSRQVTRTPAFSCWAAARLPVIMMGLWMISFKTCGEM